MTADRDPLSEAKGCVYGLLISIPIWIVIGGAVWMFAR